MKETEEEWRGVPGWPGYEVSSLGRVRSLERRVTQRRGATVYTRVMRSKVLTPRMMSSGKYLFLSLSAPDRGQIQYSVHRLVASAFHGSAPTSSHQVAHNDGNGLNNRADNLRWATPAENNADKRVHGTLFYGETHPSAKISDEAVLLIRQMRARGVSARATGESFGISTMQAWRIGARKRRAAIAGELAAGERACAKK